MNAPASASPFDRLRELSLRIPEGAQELLPLVDFLETFPEQVTEEALVHLVGVTALGIAKAGQGGLWDGSRWIFLRGNATPFPTNPGPGWLSLPWTYGDELFGHLVVRTSWAPPALPLLLSISAPLLAWRRLEALRSDQNRALALQLSRLNTLFDLTRSLGEVETKADIVHLAATSLMAEFLITRLMVVGADGTVLFSRGVGKVASPLSADALHQILADKDLVHAVELRDQNHSHGFAYAGEPTIGRLSDDDELFFQTLLNITSTQLTALELRESRIQALRMEKDLDLARNIQRRILPKQLPEPAGWQCAAANLPYEAVGGDLYDLWMAHREAGQNPRLHIALGDISGKGLPASLMMTQLSAFLRAMADRRVEDWGRLAHRLNARMNQVRDRNRYATLFAGSLNPENGDMRYVNGGHNPPLLIPGNGDPVVHLSPTGPMVGLLPGASFSEGHTTMNPGDVLLIFTDGLVEAENAQGQDLGEEPLIQVVRANPEASADELFEKILVDTFQHMEGSGFKDDVTLVVVKRIGSALGAA
jgi:sigma-B regulation protein RsbU (phosphoserine phosphatase)